MRRMMGRSFTSKMMILAFGPSGCLPPRGECLRKTAYSKAPENRGAAFLRCKDRPRVKMRAFSVSLRIRRLPRNSMRSIRAALVWRQERRGSLWLGVGGVTGAPGVIWAAGAAEREQTEGEREQPRNVNARKTGRNFYVRPWQMSRPPPQAKIVLLPPDPRGTGLRASDSLVDNRGCLNHRPEAQALPRRRKSAASPASVFHPESALRRADLPRTSAKPAATAAPRSCGPRTFSRESTGVLPATRQSAPAGESACR